MSNYCGRKHWWYYDQFTYVWKWKKAIVYAQRMWRKSPLSLYRLGIKVTQNRLSEAKVRLNSVKRIHAHPCKRTNLYTENSMDRDERVYVCARKDTDAFGIEWLFRLIGRTSKRIDTDELQWACNPEREDVSAVHINAWNSTKMTWNDGLKTNILRLNEEIRNKEREEGEDKQEKQSMQFP